MPLQMTNLIQKILDGLGLHPANLKPLEAQILAEFPAQGPTSKRVCFFAHFDPHGIVDPYVLHYVKELRKLGLEIVFVTTSPTFSNAEAAKLAADCSRIVLRKNDTLDFGSWRVAAHLLGIRLDDCDQLVLANDSVYGPLFDLRDAFAQMTARGAQFWGITDTRELAHHLQSYFLVFEKPLLQFGFVSAFWREFKFYRSKSRTIRKYEIGLSRRALRQAIPFQALVPSDPSDPRNPTLYLWDRLIRERRMPFLKTECLKLNRTHSPVIRQWAEIIRESGSTYPPELIQRHLERVGMAPELRKEPGTL